jgi:two-component system NtrC family response regulator
MKKSKIVIAEDDPSLSRIMEYSLKGEGFEVYVFPNGKEALSFLKEKDADLIISDLSMPEMGGMELLKEAQKIKIEAPFIIITAFGTIDSAVEAMKAGAYDYITKPFSQEELSLIVKKALELKSLKEENISLKSQLTEKYKFENIAGKSPKMEKIFELISLVAGTNSNVLILGESGTGKELVAKAIHYHSSRASGPFIAVQCAAIPPTLLESELFGHVKGAFTGAIKDREGKFELADEGTLFLDEIAEMSPEMQAKLLRAIQEREIDRVGSSSPVKIDVRIIAATNQELERLVKEKKFREDLYYRLNVISVLLPALRERKEDIPSLIEHFLKKFGDTDCQIEDEAMHSLMNYSWPGNVRELENTIERALVLKKDCVIRKENLPEKIWKGEKRIGNVVMDLPEEGIDLEEVEKELIKIALEKANGNQTQAAKYLGISRPTLLYRMEKYKLE